MADWKNRWPEQPNGRFYVDRECINCTVCSDAAPNNFRPVDDDSHKFVYKQPESPEEEIQSYEAMENCPVNAIGDDGK